MGAPAKGIPIENAVKFGWETFKKNIQFILAVEVAALLAEGAVSLGTEWMERIGGFHEWAMGIAYFVVSMIIQMGAIKIALKYRDGEKVEFANMFDGFAILPAFMAAAVLKALAVGFGLMFLIVPGIVIAIRFWFFGYMVVDEERGPIEAIQRSITITEGVGVDLFLFGLLLIGINFLGLLAFGLGLFVTVPVTILATAYVYRYLNPRPGSAPKEAPATSGPAQGPA